MKNTIETKTCKVCHTEQPKLNFVGKSRGHFRPVCHECSKIENNAKKCRRCLITKDLSEFYHNGDRCWTCADCSKELSNINHRENREKEIKEMKEYRDNNPEKTLFWHVKSRVKEHNLPFNLEISDIVIPKFCPVLGIELKKGEGRHCPNSPTVDKIIPELGYVKGNVEVISWRANSIKRDATLDEMKRIVAYMERYLTIT